VTLTWQTRSAPSYPKVKIQGLSGCVGSWCAIACKYQNNATCYASYCVDQSRKLGLALFRPLERQHGHESPHFVPAIHIYHSIRQSKDYHKQIKLCSASWILCRIPSLADQSFYILRTQTKSA